MEESGASQPMANIWDISDSVVDRNKDIKKEVLSDMPDEDKIAINVNGYVINELGNIVAQFGFFAEEAENDTIDLKISADGFLAKIYNEPTNIILGYGHPFGFTGLIDPKKSQILHLGPKAANGDSIIVSIPNDDLLKEQGVVFVIREEDVMLELLSDDVREDFQESCIDADEEPTDLNEIEQSYNNYVKHIHVILGEDMSADQVPVGEEEVYE